VVLIGRSKYATLYGLVVLSWPLIPLVIGPLYSTLDDCWTEHRIAGDFKYLRPSQRRLAHALRAHDAELVKALIPKAGDLNVEHGGESLFAFGLRNAAKSAASVEITKALLQGGVNPDLATSGGMWPLTAAIACGPGMTQLLLNAGANPNRVDEIGRPVWWYVLYDGSPEGQQTLVILLDHGADLARRDRGGGPVGWAAYQKNWRAVWLMMERGAAWKDELALGQPIPFLLGMDLDSRRAGHLEIPEEMERILAQYGAEPPYR